MLEKVKAAFKRIAGDRTVQRGFWTAVELGAGCVVVALGASTGVGAVVVFLAVAIKEAAVRRLAKTSDAVAPR